MIGIIIAIVSVVLFLIYILYICGLFTTEKQYLVTYKWFGNGEGVGEILITGVKVLNYEAIKKNDLELVRLARINKGQE